MSNVTPLQQLKDLAGSLPAFHLALLDVVKIRHELKEGHIAGPHEYFNLVTTHPTFAPLRVLSGYMAEIDERTDAHKKGHEVTAADVLHFAEKLNNILGGPDHPDFQAVLESARGNAKVASTLQDVQQALRAAMGSAVQA